MDMIVSCVYAHTEFQNETNEPSLQLWPLISSAPKLLMPKWQCLQTELLKQRNVLFLRPLLAWRLIVMNLVRPHSLNNWL
jgi:hypothetical protein